MNTILRQFEQENRTSGGAWQLHQSRLDVAPPGGCVSDCRLFREVPDEEDIGRSKSLMEAEQIIAEDLYKLSRAEREEILHDIHGVSDPLNEDAANIAMCKDQLEFNLLQFQHRSQAFQIVWSQAPNYVRQLYLAFLRCDAFDVKQAAERIRVHFDTKLWLFGIDKLCRDIQLEDFDKDDMASHKAGFFQVLPIRDRAGRAIVIKLWKLQKFKCRENVWRQIWYDYMTLLFDEETQKKGTVQIVYNVNDHWTENFDPELYMGVGKIRAALPLRIVSVHYCFNDPAFGAIIKLVTTAMEMHTRTRTRLHCGTDIEVQYALQSFGIPLKQLPVNSEGKLRTKEHLVWTKGRLYQEKCGRFDHSNSIVVPTHADVLYGRGKTMQNHLGNLRFANILEEKMELYMQAKRNVKLAIAIEIVERIKKQGGRFLRQGSDGIWEEVSGKDAADKVSHGFRNRKTTTVRKPSSTVYAQKGEKRPVSPSDTSQQSSTNGVSKVVIDSRFIASKRSRDDGSKSSQTASTCSSSDGGSDNITRRPDKPHELQSVPESLDIIPLDLEAVGDTDTNHLAALGVSDGF